MIAFCTDGVSGSDSWCQQIQGGMAWIAKAAAATGTAPAAHASAHAARHGPLGPDRSARPAERLFLGSCGLLEGQGAWRATGRQIVSLHWDPLALGHGLGAMGAGGGPPLAASAAASWAPKPAGSCRPAPPSPDGPWLRDWLARRPASGQRLAITSPLQGSRCGEAV